MVADGLVRDVGAGIVSFLIAMVSVGSVGYVGFVRPLVSFIDEMESVNKGITGPN